MRKSNKNLLNQPDPRAIFFDAKLLLLDNADLKGAKCGINSVNSKKWRISLRLFLILKQSVAVLKNLLKILDFLAPYKRYDDKKNLVPLRKFNKNLLNLPNQRAVFFDSKLKEIKYGINSVD